MVKFKGNSNKLDKDKYKFKEALYNKLRAQRSEFLRTVADHYKSTAPSWSGLSEQSFRANVSLTPSVAPFISEQPADSGPSRPWNASSVDTQINSAIVSSKSKSPKESAWVTINSPAAKDGVWDTGEGTSYPGIGELISDVESKTVYRRKV